MKNPLQQQYEVEVSKDSDDAPNISVIAENGTIQIKFNHWRLFNTMANKDAILVGLNEKITELTQNHLHSQADKEDRVREER